jgi:single-stranded DNA-binding protein
MSLNRVLLVGHVTDTRPKLTYSERGRPECRLTLMLTEAGKDGQAFTVYAPIYVLGNGAETVAEQVDAGDVVSIDGRLGWRSTLQKNGCKIGLVVTCFGVEIITKALVTMDAGESSLPEG